MLTENDAIPFRLCSSKPQSNLNSRSKKFIKAQNRPQLSKWVARNNPQPLYVKHFAGLNDMPICRVKDTPSTASRTSRTNRQNDILIETNTLNGLPVFRYRNIPKVERALPQMGLVEIYEPWRYELKALAESLLFPILNNKITGENKRIYSTSGLTEYHPYPICRPTTSMVQSASHLVKVNQSSYVLTTAKSSRSGKSSRGRQSSRDQHRDSYFWNDNWSNDYESQVFSLLGQILQLDDVEEIKKWLSLASDRDKAAIIGILENVFTARNSTAQTATQSLYDEPPHDNSDREEHTPTMDRLVIDAEEDTERLLSKRTQTSRQSMIRPQTSNCTPMTPKDESSRPITLRYKTASVSRSSNNHDSSENQRYLPTIDDFKESYDEMENPYFTDL